MPSSSPSSRRSRPTEAAPLTAYAKIERIAEPWALNRTFAIAGTLVLAMVFGSWVASGEFENLLLFAIWLIATMIIIFVQDHWWSPALIITSLCITTTALGFALSGLEIGMVILAITFPVKIAMKTLRKAEPEMDPGVLYWMLLAYVCTHAVLILGYEHIQGTPLKNIVKAYYTAVAPLVFYGMLIRYCHTRTVKPTVMWLFYVTFIAVFFSLIVIILGIDIQPLSELRISIGWLNSRDAQIILRYGGSALFVGCLAFWPAVSSGMPRFLLGCAIVVSALGTVFGGGRLTLATCVAGAIFFAIIRGRILLAVPVLVLTAAISLLMTVHPDVVYSMPLTVQRALAPVNFSGQKSEIQEGLVGSDEWHDVLRRESLPYWMADPVSFFVGHGFKAWDYSLSDQTDGGDIMDFERYKQLAIEMGITENMFSSVTNIFGLIGLVLYGLFLINLAFDLWKASRLSPERSFARALCEYSLVILVATIVSAPFEGGTPGITLVYWALGLLAARPYIAGKQLVPAPAALRPAFARPAFEERPSLARTPRGRMRPSQA